MRKPPFNRSVFSGAFGAVFSKVFGNGAEFSPLDIPNLLAWYDATDAGSIISSGGLVSQWSDKSGNANHITQGTGSDQPTTGVELINGLNAIGFDGTDDFLDIVSITVTPDLTIAFVFNVVSVSQNAESILSMDDTVGNSDFQIDANSNTQFFADFDSTGLGSLGTIQSPSDLVGVDTALMYRLSTADSSIRLFNANVEVDSSVSSYNGSLGADQNFQLGANRGDSRFLEVNFGEVVIINRDITDVERTNLFNYFSRWGV